MKKLLGATGIALIMAAPAFAQTDAAAPEASPEASSAEPTAGAETGTAAAVNDDGEFIYTAVPGDLSADVFTDKTLYVSPTDIDTTATFNDADADWESIGEIDDLVIGEDGRVQAVLVDIGGFLGMGSKTVAVSMDRLQVVRDGDSDDDYFVVFTADREKLENAAEFEWPDEAM